MDCCWIVSLKVGQGKTDLVEFSLEIFMEVQGKFKQCDKKHTHSK